MLQLTFSWVMLSLLPSNEQPSITRLCARSSLSVAQLLPLLQLATSGTAADVRSNARELLADRLRATGMFGDWPWESGIWLAALPVETK